MFTVIVTFLSAIFLFVIDMAREDINIYEELDIWNGSIEDEFHLLEYEN
jgi:hypothetical protein